MEGTHYHARLNSLTINELIELRVFLYFLTLQVDKKNTILKVGSKVKIKFVKIEKKIEKKEVFHP